LTARGRSRKAKPASGKGRRSGLHRADPLPPGGPEREGGQHWFNRCGVGNEEGKWPPSASGVKSYRGRRKVRKAKGRVKEKRACHKSFGERSSEAGRGGRATGVRKTVFALWKVRINVDWQEPPLLGRREKKLEARSSKGSLKKGARILEQESPYFVYETFYKSVTIEIG